jgi:hypothetical protein
MLFPGAAERLPTLAENRMVCKNLLRDAHDVFNNVATEVKVVGAFARSKTFVVKPDANAEASEGAATPKAAPIAAHCFAPAEEQAAILKVQALARGHAQRSSPTLMRTCTFDDDQ